MAVASLAVVVVAALVALIGALVVMIALFRNSQSSPRGNSNLRPCPDCGQPVSVRAVTCPHCGAPLKSF